jgi:CRISPR/Cas system CSM-associated protein Csm2 small subunit
MKHNIVIGSLVFGLGMVTGWFIKPAPTSLASSEAARGSASKALTSAALTSPSEPAIPGKRAQREPVVQKPANMPTEEQMAQANKMQGEALKAMVKRHRAKLAQQIVRLDEKLQLTTEQKSGLTTWLDDQMKKMESMDLSDRSSFGKLHELASSITIEALENQLATTLTSDQQAALADFKDNDLHLKADAMALKSLSKLQGIIEFEDGQRDEVYKILTKNAEATTLAESKNTDMAKFYTEDMGIDMDPYDLGLQQAITDFMTDMGKEQTTTLDQSQIAQKIRELVDKRIEEKVNQLQPVLNDKQLARYREELKSKGKPNLGPVSMGTDDAQSKK